MVHDSVIHLVHAMRVLVLAASLAIISSACGKSECEKAGGRCEAITPGACLSLVVGDSGRYSCDSGTGSVCCLPLSFSPCEQAGGSCVQVASGACSNGTVGTKPCANGGSMECCMPAADGGR
jgi:hypothetical protein